jgi:hypothetical protein
MITACNQPAGSDVKIDAPSVLADLVGRNRRRSSPRQPMVFPSQAIALVLEKGRFEGGLRCRTKSGQGLRSSTLS